MKPDLLDIYSHMLYHFGHRKWWPGDSRFEIILGAILTQNTNWKNVEKALQNLKDAKCLSYKKISAMPIDQLAELIRPSGYYNQKAIKIKAFISFVNRFYKGSLKKLFSVETTLLRDQLLSIKGIGPETADSILLYAGDHLSFVVDLYTYRILTRHGWMPPEVVYHEMKEFFEESISKDIDLYKDYHAQLVAVGNNFCRKTPKCEDCPLRPFLKNDQPILMD